MVTESPTDTMNSTMPAARPPSTMLTTSMPKITSGPQSVGDIDRATPPSFPSAAAASYVRTLAKASVNYLQGGIFSALQASFTFSTVAIVF